MDASRDFFAPDRRASQLVPVAALRHENVAEPKRISFFIGLPNRDLFDDRKIEMSSLHISNPKVGRINSFVCRNLLALGYAADDHEQVVEGRERPTFGKIEPHIGAAQLRDWWADAKTFICASADLCLLQPLQQFRRRLVVRILRYQLATHSKVKDGLAQLLDLVGARGEGGQRVEGKAGVRLEGFGIGSIETGEAHRGHPPRCADS
jgi:hypothetical protein